MLDLTGDNESFKCDHVWNIWESKQKEQLNKYQQEAIKKACQCEFVMIQGPPGKLYDSLAMMKLFYIFAPIFTVFFEPAFATLVALRSESEC